MAGLPSEPIFKMKFAMRRSHTQSEIRLRALTDARKAA
jgi:hypothetical protein